MTAIVFVDQPSADSYAIAIDGKVGYPRNGIDVGGGIHAAKSETRTLRYANVLKHPTLSLWAYPDDGVVQAQALVLPGGATIQTLDASWTPAPVAF